MDSPDKSSTRDQGLEAETSALRYLKGLGCSILERNYRSRRGEVDLIARKGGVIYFVEVKLRRSGRFGSAAQAISPSKQRKIALAAMDYVQRAKIKGQDLRFAALVMDESEGKRHVEFFEFSLDLPMQYY